MAAITQKPDLSVALPALPRWVGSGKGGVGQTARQATDQPASQLICMMGHLQLDGGSQRRGLVAPPTLTLT